jgi:hypothetical protein
MMEEAGSVKVKQKHVPSSLDGYIIAFMQESLHDRDICIYGDSEGLRSLGEAIIAIANLDQKHLSDRECPADDSFHQHYVTGLRLSGHDRQRLARLTIGRADEKTSGQIRDAFPSKTKSRRR